MIDCAAGGAELRAAFDALDWVGQVRYVARHDMDAPMMRHVARHGDPAARMALALKPGLPATVRRILAADPNPQVRSNVSGGAGGMEE